ncbi:MAG: glycosyltransferase family A protein, partial [Desulfovibrionaceae bacterium]
MKFSWNTLPRPLAEPLLKGSVGRFQLAELADVALNLTKEVPAPQAAHLLDLASDMFSAAWESDFLDADMARQALTMHGMRPFLHKSFDKIAHLLCALVRLPEDTAELRACLMTRNAEQTLQYVEHMRKADPTNLFWTRQGIMVGMVEGQLDWLERWAHTTDPSLPRPFVESLLGDIAYCRGEYKDACGRYMTALRALPFLAWREKLGEALFHMGQIPEALGQWEAVLARRPWHTNLVLRCDDVRRGRHEAGPLPHGKGAVLLYTWNKAEELALTLTSLAASQLGEARIIVLDNGSTDATPEVIRAW